MTPIKMPDRRQEQGPKTAEGIARAKLASLALREGDPAKEEVKREMLILLQAEFGAAAQIVATPDAVSGVESTEQLDEALKACLEQLKGDFNRGIVRIEAKGTLEYYAAALKADKTAGQTWEAIEVKLRANNAQKLRLAAAMPEGACLIGVHEDGEPAIRQRSREIVNVIVTKEGKLVTLPHAEAVQRVASTREQYGKAVEIVKGVKEAGYRVPADSPNHEKEGLVAASEAVMGGNYVESPVTGDPRNREWRSTMLECPENTPDRSNVRVVYFNPAFQETGVGIDFAVFRGGYQGAVLWL